MADDKRVNKLEDKIDKIVDKLSDIDTTLAKQEVNLSLHMKRSDALEAQIEPLKEHVANVSGAIKLLKTLGYVSGILGAIHTVCKIFRIY